MVAFEHGRPVTGGALLAAAILSKVFPAVLLVTLVARRAWRPMAWTCAFAVIFTCLALSVLGPRPFVSFLSYQVHAAAVW